MRSSGCLKLRLMASLIWDKSKEGKTARIQFVVGDRRPAVRLGKVPVKVATTWLFRVEQLVANQVGGVAHDADLAAWLRDLPEKAYGRLAKVGLVPVRDAASAVTVVKLTEAFTDRSSGRPATIAGYKQTLDSLVAFFGADTAITSITAEGADAWRVWVVKDKKGSGRRKKLRTTDDNRLSPPTVAKRVSVAKQVFRSAVRWGWLEKSPFDGLRPGSQANPARAFYVDQSTTTEVLAACPSQDWRVVVALARYAGLRCPSEVGALTWDDVNWEKGRLTVRSKKTEHHGADHAVRVVPICPELRALLVEAFEAAEPGATTIVPMAARQRVNLGTYLKRIILKAGHKPWPRIFQNLRASCATDWVEQYPSHVVAKWLGHSPKVAAQHYLMSKDRHFEDVVGGGRGEPMPGGAGQERPQKCDAKYDAIETRNATPQPPAAGGREPQKKTEPAATTRVAAGSSGIEPVVKTGKWRGQDSNL